MEPPEELHGAVRARELDCRRDELGYADREHREIHAALTRMIRDRSAQLLGRDRHRAQHLGVRPSRRKRLADEDLGGALRTGREHM
jgi:hypothetical protein